jgi:4-hydroxy-tetrahydrodipicolinate synthase
MADFQNVITALVTPFYKGEVDELSFTRLIHQQLEAGIRGFVINGTTAESPTLREEEVKRLFEIVKTEVGKRGTFILGTGSNSTVQTIENTKKAKAMGADAALVVVPYYNKPPQRGMIAHFNKIADECELPILLYNVPSRTVASLEPASVQTLSENPKIIGIKEASGDLTVFNELKKIGRQPFYLLSGDDGTGVEFCLNGGHGIISVISHVIPKELNDLVHKARKGDASVTSAYANYKELLRWLYIEANPIPTKWALSQMGILRSMELRLPLAELSNSYFEGFKACLKKLGKI